MKKFYLMAAVAVAIAFTSCGNKTKNTETVDSASVAVDSATSNLSTEAKAAVNGLNEQLSKGDAKGVAAALTGSLAKVTELARKNPEQAKQYVVQLQEWIKNNKETIQTTLAKVNNPALSAALHQAVNSVSSIDPANVVNSLKDAAAAKANAVATEAAKNAVDETVEAKTGVTDATAKAQEAIDKAKNAVDKAPAEVKEKVNAAASAAKEKATEKAKEAAGAAAQKALKGLGF